MEQPAIVRNPSRQTLLALYFLLIFLLSLTIVFQHSTTLHVLGAFFLVVSVAGMVRSNYMFYLEVSTVDVKVRTFLRTRHFDPRTIQKVEPKEFAQYTARVLPVITFTDGRQYKLSEFFTQRKSNYKHQERSIVTKAIQALETSQS
jgi:hypothetical protein